MKRREIADRIRCIKDNKGSAIVMVLVIIAFVSILVSVVCYRSILNYQMKVVDYNAKDNFYSAENALDEIRTGLQSVASNAIAESYIEIMQNYDKYTNEQRKQQFSNLFMLKLEAALKDDTLSTPTSTKTYYDVSILEDFITNPVTPGGTVGAELAPGGTSNELIPYEDAMVLKNVNVTCTDSDGYVSIINTDIRINVPAIDFNEAFKYPDIMDYSIIANDSLLVQQGNVAIKGNLYAGNNGIIVGDTALNAHLTVDETDVIVTDGTIQVGNGDSFKYTKSAEADTNLWAKGIVLDSSDVEIDSTIHVADDTTINGKNSQLTYKGAYYGFGTERGSSGNGSDGSSSILVNGINSSLDFSGLDALTLAGNAYIGISGKGDMTYNVGGTEIVKVDGTDEFTEKDNILMGESLAIKSDQLAYLVPPECIGYYKDTCILGSNPVTKARLDNEFITPRSLAADADKALYQEVNMNMVSSLGATLTELGAQIRKLYKREGDNTTLVYYYMVFNSQEDANYFFRQYYANNKEKMDSYISKYVAKLDMGNYGALSVNLAGNIMRAENGDAGITYILEEDSLAASSADVDYTNTLLFYKEQYEALCTKLVTDSLLITDADRANKVEGADGLFGNVIDGDVILNRFPDDADATKSIYEGTANIRYARFGTDLDECHAIVVKNPTTPYIITNGADMDKIRVVVATGDVTVQAGCNYKGVIVAKGKVTIENGASVTKDEEGVAKAMQLSRLVNGTTYNVIEVFKDGSALEVSSGGAGTGTDEEHVEVEELVGYSNWTKQ